MMKFYATNILLESGWAADKTITVNDGIISSIEDGRVGEVVHLDGPVIPGMINAHSHAFQRAFAGLTEYRTQSSDSFWSWRKLIYELLKHLTPEDLKLIAHYLYQRMLENGYTSCAEFHYLHHQADGSHYEDTAIMSKALIEAAENSGIYLRLMPVFYHYSDFGKKPINREQLAFFFEVDKFKDLVSQLKQNFKSNNNLSFAIAPHSLRAVSKEQLSELSDWWQDDPIHIHISEQTREVEGCVAHYSKRPIEWLIDNYSVDQRWGLVHATHLTKSEMSLLEDSRATPILCPHTEANLGDGIFPATEWVAKQRRFAIGSDSQICLSPFEELKLVEYGQRLHHQKRNCLCSTEFPNVGSYLWQATAAAGNYIVNSNAGRLRVGNRADFVVLKTLDSNVECTPQSALDYAVFAAAKNPVKDVWVAGVQKVSNGIHHHSDETKGYSDWLGTMLKRL